MASRFNIYCTGHQHSRVVCDALARGTGLPVVAPAPLLAGGVAMYGFLRGLLPTLQTARADGRPWVYIDRGYFRATYGDDYTGFFRVTRGAWQHSGRGLGVVETTRWENLLLKIQPWRRGRHVLVCPPGDVFTQAVGGFSAKEWLDSTLEKLHANTDRPVVVRHKPAKGDKTPPLAHDLQDCHALVTYMSNTAVEAVLAGVPVFTTGQCAASAMGKKDLSEIESPAYPDGRESWAATLANNQWTLAELSKGAANHIFN